MNKSQAVIPAQAGIQDNDLPEGWERLAIEDIAEVNPRVDKSKISDDLLVSFVPMPAVEAESGAIDVSEERPFAEVKKGFTPFTEGDVLFAKITPCMENGKMAVVPKVKNGYGFGSTEFHVLRAKEGIESKYIYYFVSSRTFRGVAQHNMSGAVGQKRVPTNYLKQHLIPVAPPEQQKRIVAKIEELFSHIDAGIEALKKAKQLLKQYRQSVLKAAVTGELTKEWHEANKDKLEPASDVHGSTSAAVVGREGAAQLLERILKERRQKWEEQRLDQFKAKGKMPKNDRWKEKYKEPKVPDVTDLPMLPEQWLWSGFEQVSSPEKNGMKAGPFGSALKKQFYVEKGYKIYGQEQVINNDPYYGDYYIDEEKYHSLINCAVKPGDFLISLVGTIGRTLVLPDDIEPGIINPRLIKITFDKNYCLPEYVQIYVASPAAKQIFELSSHGGTMDVLNMATLKALPLPLPSVSEQKAIIKLVKEKEDTIQRQNNYIDNQMLLIEKSKQSILASAFSGALHQ